MALMSQKLLSPDEFTRANRFHFPRHRRRFTLARSLMRLILAHYLDSSPDALTFSYNKQGKPELLNLPLSFNLSHSGDYAVLAVGKHHPMGIDLEFFSARPYKGIARTAFSPQENQALNLLPATIQPFAFFQTWSQKEAFIKACGLGLSYPTQQFSVPILGANNTLIYDEIHQISWRMLSFMPHPACSAALCYHPQIKTLQWIDFC